MSDVPTLDHATIHQILEVIRYNEAVDENGDPVGVEPETQWEVGYAAGVRCIYRFLKKAAGPCP